MGQIDGFLKYNRVDNEYAPVQDRVGSFDEFVQDVPETVIKDQAARCMDCGIPFCHNGCPLGNKIPDFNDAVHSGDWKEAFDVLKSTNNFPEFTGRICPAPCEGSCVLGINNDPVSIENIEKQVIERAFLEGWETPFVKVHNTGQHVAVIGSGPAGLAAADELNKFGHDVVVFERDKEAGGLLRYGIPDFKLNKEIVERRVKLLKASGIRFKTGVEVGKDISSSQLHEEFDALIVCTGSTVPRDLPIPGRDLEGVHFAMDFLTLQNKINSGEATHIPEEFSANEKHIIVIGGGDTGSDCVGTSIRQGAKSVLQIELMGQPPTERDSDNPWPEWPMVLRTSSSQAEGCERSWSILTKRFIGSEHGEIKGLEVVDVEWIDKAKFQFKEIEGTNEMLPCDMALLAVGFSHPQKNGLLEELGLETDGRGNIKATGYQTNKERIFASGDCRRGQSLVVWAISEGRKAAKAVHQYVNSITV